MTDQGHLLILLIRAAALVLLAVNLVYRSGQIPMGIGI